MDFANCRTCAFRHKTLSVDWDHLVFFNKKVPTWLAPPCRLTIGRIEKKAFSLLKYALHTRYLIAVLYAGKTRQGYRGNKKIYLMGGRIKT